MAASTTPIHGKTALPVLSISTDGGSVFNPVAELREPAFPAVTVTSGDTTNTDITDGYMTKLAGWAELQSFSLVLNFREDTVEQLQAVIGLDIDIQIEWTDPGHSTTDSKIVFSAHVDNVEMVAPNDDVWTINLSITPSGKDTFTPGT